MVRKKLKLTESELIELISQVISEQYSGGIIKQGDEPCEIWCERKYAKRGSRGDVVKMIQHLLARGCGDYGPYNPEKMGGGMNEGCAENWTNCDGKFEKETKKAVEEYQGDYSGLVVDGNVGINTLSALCELCYKPTIFPDDFTLCDKQCNCKQQSTDNPGGDDILDVVDGDDWFDIVDISPEYGDDCDTIKNCLQYASRKDGERWHYFMECMKTGGLQDKTGKNKPDWFNSSCMKWIPYDWEKGGVVICISDQGSSQGPYYSNGKGILVAPDKPNDAIFRHYENLKMSETEARKLGIKNLDETVVASACCTKRRWKLDEQKKESPSIYTFDNIWSYITTGKNKFENEVIEAKKKAEQLRKEYEVGPLKPGITAATNYNFMKGHCQKFCGWSETVHEEFMSKHITKFGEKEAYLLMKLIEGLELCEFDDMHEGALGLGCNYIKKDLELMLKMLGYKRKKKQ